MDGHPERSEGSSKCELGSLIALKNLVCHFDPSADGENSKEFDVLTRSVDLSHTFEMAKTTWSP